MLLLLKDYLRMKIFFLSLSKYKLHVVVCKVYEPERGSNEPNLNPRGVTRLYENFQTDSTWNLGGQNTEFPGRLFVRVKASQLTRTTMNSNI